MHWNPYSWNNLITKTFSRCPKCNFTLDSVDQIFPNFLFNELVSKYKNSLESRLTNSNLLNHPDLSAFKSALASNFDSMSLPDVDLMLKLLETKKQQLAANSVLTQKQLLKVLAHYFVFLFKFSCLPGISATFEETKRRTALCITKGSRCDSGKTLCAFTIS